MEPSVLLGHRILVSVAMGLIVCVGAVAWRRRDTPGTNALLVLAAAMLLWTGGQLGAALAGSRAGTLAWLKVEWIGIAVAPTAMLLFFLAYTGRERFVTRRTVAVLAIEPCVVYALVLTNDFHGYIWADVERATGTITGFVLSHGPGFWAHLLYSYAVVTVVTVIVLELFFRSRALHRRQAQALLVGLAGPWAANVVYVTGLTTVDMTPIGFSGTAVALGFAIARYRFVDVVPVARDTVVDNITDGVFVLDDDDRIVDANPSGKRLIEAEGRSLVGRDAAEAFPETMTERIDDLAHGTNEFWVEGEDGGRYLSIEITPLSDDADRLVGSLLLVRDVTDELRYQRELERQNDRLDRVASVVSHDLRNPLNVAQGYLDIVEERTDDPGLEKIDRSLNRMERMVEDVLALARQGESIADGDRQPVDVGALASDSWSNVATDDASLSVVLDHTVQAERSRLAHVFENLYRNAIEHGGESVAVEVGPLERDSAPAGARNPVVGFYVEDDGPGIPEEDHETVFEPGYTTIATGTGLGLDIVKSVVEAHGWELSVTDADDGGARFEVSYEETVALGRVPRP